MKDRETIITNYINAYNAFDIDKMLIDFDENISFDNIADGVTNITLIGITQFKEQAKHAKDLFLKRTQTIESFAHKNDETEVEIDYSGILATDLTNGIKKGDELKLKGKSILKFYGNKIIQLTDIS